MNDDALAQMMAALEARIGPERLAALRREAARRRVSVLSLLGDAVARHAGALAAAADPVLPTRFLKSGEAAGTGAGRAPGAGPRAAGRGEPPK